MLPQPSNQCLRLMISQEIDDDVPLQAAQCRAVAMAAPPIPIVDAGHPRRRPLYLGLVTGFGEQSLQANADIIRQVPQQARAWQQLRGSAVELDRPLLATSADAERAIGVAGQII